jgi:hypothetical protein
MNLFELFFFLLACFLSFRLGVYFVGRIGWWGVLPAVVLGFGFIGGLLAAVRKLLGRRNPGQTGHPSEQQGKDDASHRLKQ